MKTATLKFQPRSVSRLYFIAAIGLFVGQIRLRPHARPAVPGSATWPSLAIPFNIARMVHTNLLIVWLLFGFMGSAYYHPRGGRTELHSPSSPKLLFWIFLVAGAATILGYLLVPYATLAEMTATTPGKTMGREFSSSRCRPRSAS